MRLPAFRLHILIVAFLAASGAFTPAYAQWMDVGTVSATIGNNAGRLCMGGGRTDFGCPADAPLLDRANNLLTVPTDLRVVGNLLVSGSQQFDGVTFANGGVVATGTVSATNFVGDGSGLTGIDFGNNPIDRIVSGTAAVIAQEGGTVGLTLGGVANVAYFHPTLGFVGPGVSTTGPISGTQIFSSGAATFNGGILLNQGPLGTHNLIYAGSASPGPVDASMGFFVAGRGSNIASQGGYFLGRGNNFSGASNQRGNLLFVAGYPTGATATEGSIQFMTASEVRRMIIEINGNVGIGTTAPAAVQLDVSGTLKLAAGTEPCDASRAGAIKFTGGQFQVCRNGTSWEYMVAGTSGSVDADRITSGTTAVVTHRDTSVTITTNGNERMIVGTNGNVGIGVSTPGRALTVNGVVSATMLNVGEDPAVTCTIAEYGTLKVAGGKMFMCRQ